jgi:hypothetical protein
MVELGQPCSETTCQCQTIHGGGVQGDPACQDLGWNTLISSCFKVPKFKSGVSVDLHIRTTMRREMSYISSATLRIGTDVIEVERKGVYYKHGVLGAGMPNKISGFTVAHSQPNENQHMLLTTTWAVVNPP